MMFSLSSIIADAAVRDLTSLDRVKRFSLKAIAGLAVVGSSYFGGKASVIGLDRTGADRAELVESFDHHITYSGRTEAEAVETMQWQIHVNDLRLPKDGSAYGAKDGDIRLRGNPMDLVALAFRYRTQLAAERHPYNYQKTMGIDLKLSSYGPIIGEDVAPEFTYQLQQVFRNHGFKLSVTDRKNIVRITRTTLEVFDEKVFMPDFVKGPRQMVPVYYETISPIELLKAIRETISERAGVFGQTWTETGYMYRPGYVEIEIAESSVVRDRLDFE